MNARDDYFYQAVVYAKEKDYHAARAMLRNLLFKYPDDIEGLLLYSIVAPNRDVSIQALKRILLIDPDHEIAFAKLAKLKFAPPTSIPTPMVPPPISASVLKPISISAKASEEAFQKKPLESRLKHASPPPIPTPTAPRSIPAPVIKPVSHPKAPEEIIKRKTLEPSRRIEASNNSARKKKRKKRLIVDIILVTLLIITCLCVSFAIMQELSRLFAAGS